MKGAIYYYTGTGNTKLACCSIAENINHIDFDLIDITTSKNPNLSKYEVVGFASPTFYMGIPKIFKDFLFGIKEQDKKPAFILNTFGMMQGKALKLMNKIISNNGFEIIAAGSLHMPESYPVFIAKGWGEVNRPNEQQVHDFQRFIADLSSKLENLKRGEMPPEIKISVGFLNNIIPVSSREKIIKQMGELKVDTALCSGCGVCVKVCPYGAVSQNSYPIVEQNKCWGCWKCYNHCPQKAIYTDRIKSDFQYHGPDNELSEKLNIDLNKDTF